MLSIPVVFLPRMKNVLVYILLVATLLPLVSSWGTIAYYHVNKDYIARVLCENRDKPELHCDGQCYLAKKLKTQQDRRDEETIEWVQNMPLFQLFCDTHPVFSFAPLADCQPQRCAFTYLLAVYAAPLASVFQPPVVGC